MIKVCPSTNPCDENNLLDYARELYDMGVEYLHCDVMDGVFVESKCLSFEVLENVRNNCNIGLDIHLMVENSLAEAIKFAELKPNIITIHYESPKSLKEFQQIFDYLHSKDILIGLSIKPNTPVDIISRFLDKIDLLLIMSVEPGKSGQKFIPECLDKVIKAKNLIGRKRVILEIDGGVNEDNFQDIINAGAEFLVMGSAFYKSKDKSKLLFNIDKHYLSTK